MSSGRGSVVAADPEPGRELPVRVRGQRLRLWLREARAPQGTMLVAVDRGTARFGENLRGLAALVGARDWNVCSVDLLSADERRNPLVRFDIPLLSERLAATVQLARSRGALQGPLVVAASGNAAPAGLWLHAENGLANALVSIGGRPHLAEPRLGEIRCPILLLVAESDPRLMHLNRLAQRRLGDDCKLTAIPATSTPSDRNPYAVGADAWLKRVIPPDSTAPPVQTWRQMLITSRLMKTLTGA